PLAKGLNVSISFGRVLAPILGLSDTKAVVEVPKEATDGEIYLTVDNKTATSTAFQLIHPPVIKKAEPTTGPVGTTVKINGHGFSPQADSNHVSFNGYKTDVLKADSTTLTVKVPKEATTGTIKVKVGDQTAEGPTFTVTKTSKTQVEVTDIAPKQGPVGTDVTIKGQNFSTTKKNNTVTFNGAKAAIKSASKTKLVVSVPQKATDGPVKVTVNGQTASGPSFDITQKPIPQVQVTGLSPKKGPVGTKVTITGKNFSSTKSKNTVMFNGTKATIKSASTTKLVRSEE